MRRRPAAIGTSLGSRLYLSLLRLYPREFREEYGAEMARLYRDRARDESLFRLWPVLVADVLRTAPGEQLNVLWQDVRHAVRLFLRTPIVSATALLTIALAVGGTTAVFSLVYAVLLRPLPYPAPDRLVELFEANREVAAFRASALNYRSWAERASSMDALAAFAGADVTLTDQGEAERLTGAAITSSMFRVLGLPPLAGRAFSLEDERPGARRVAVIAEALWRRRFGGSPAIIGQSITLSGERHEVIGIVPQAFRDVGRQRVSSTGQPEIFLPLTIDPARENRGNHTLRVVGRLRPGVSMERARDEMRRIAAALEQEFPASNKGWSVRVQSIYDSMLDERVRPSLLVLLAAVGMVLLIACANVANVLLARSISRQREMALRTALGAGRSRLVRQLVTESLCLAVVSGACGVLLSVFAVQALRVMLPATLPRLDEVRVDTTVLAVGLLVSVVSGLVMGLVPAVRGSRVTLTSSLVQQGRGLAGSSRMVLRQGIVVAQMAFATMLLVGAALLIQSFVRLQHVRLGFEPDGVITARISLPGAAYPDGVRISAFQSRLLESLDAMPQIQAVGLGMSAPFAPGVRAGGRARDRADASLPSDAWIPAIEHIVSPGYFETLRMPLAAGRSFGQQDGPSSPRVAVVSESLARKLWAGRNPVGQTFDWNGSRPHEVIGVVGDVRGAGGQARGGGLEQEPADAVYISAIQSPQRGMTLVVRTTAEASAIVPAIARAVRDIDPAQPLHQVRRLGDWLDETTAQPRFTTTLSGAFAIVALLLAAVGVYGVLSYSVSQRTQEIGVRMAIGAERAQIMRLVLRGGMALALAGIAIGLASAFALARGLGALLFEVTARDPMTYAAAGAMLATVALFACYIPAARATRVDPMIALRTD
jgi:putative ABC transport system permease protein